jgi:hypothetical protein
MKQLKSYILEANPSLVEEFNQLAPNIKYLHKSFDNKTFRLSLISNIQKPEPLTKREILYALDSLNKKPDNTHYVLFEEME